ncbi:MAG TPA: hypothetical protein VNH64_05755, partial [Parvularculaceae bacterium]|nr:hypothetical protein [Parvularculaceae bacterium]
DIAAAANVGRSTFYLHYKGKKDVLRQSMMRPSSVLAALIDQGAESNMLLPLLAHFREQRARNRIFFDPPVNAIWSKCVAEAMEPRLTEVARKTSAKAILPLDLIATQIAATQIALITAWIAGRGNAAPERVAEALIASAQAQTAALLKIPARGEFEGAKKGR